MKKGVLSNFARSHIFSDRVRSGYEIRQHFLLIVGPARVEVTASHVAPTEPPVRAIVSGAPESFNYHHYFRVKYHTDQ